MRGWLKTWQPVPHVGDSGGRAQVGIIRTHGFTSWVIRLFTQAKVNHMVIDTGTEVVSAEYPLVRTRPYGYFTDVVWSQFHLTDAQQDKIVAFAEEQIGKNYNWSDDLAIGVGILTRQHTPRWIMRWLSSDDEWMCSALADACLRHAGIHLWDDDRPVGAVFPGSFQNFFADAGWLPWRIFFSSKV